MSSRVSEMHNIHRITAASHARFMAEKPKHGELFRLINGFFFESEHKKSNTKKKKSNEFLIATTSTECPQELSAAVDGP